MCLKIGMSENGSLSLFLNQSAYRHSMVMQGTEIILNYSDMQGLVWGEPELVHEYDFDVEKIIAKFELCNMEECNFLVFCS